MTKEDEMTTANSFLHDKGVKSMSDKFIAYEVQNLLAEFSCARNSELEAEVKRLREENENIIASLPMVFGVSNVDRAKIVGEQFIQMSIEIDELRGNKH